jgi:nucleotide-binding universal stress UspA family protein
MAGTLTRPAEFLDRFDPVLAPSGPVLVASDASPASDAAFPQARAIALRTGAPVQVVSAMRPNAMPTYAFDAVPHPVVPSTDALEGREAMVRQQVARLVPAAAPWPVSVRAGDPVREVLDLAQAQDARLIVVGRGRHGLIERVLGGETVLRLLQLGETPVLAVERTLESLARRVVIATDFSVFSIYAAQVALDLIAPDATVQLVHVAPTLGETGPMLREFAEEYRQQADASFAQLREKLSRPGLRFETLLIEGNASTRLVEHVTAYEADLIVTATHGYGFIRRMVLGSVAAELVRSAPCSVLCVPGSARTLAAARAQATALHDSTHILPEATLDGTLAAFSTRNIGRPCTVEVNQRGIGMRSLGHHLPLVGISYDFDTRDMMLMFGASTLEGAHLSHRVPEVQLVELVRDRTERDQLLKIVHEEGQTLVLLE